MFTIVMAVVGLFAEVTRPLSIKCDQKHPNSLKVDLKIIVTCLYEQ